MIRGQAARDDGTEVGDAVGQIRWALPGIGSPEQPDLMQRGRAPAQGGSERQRGLGEQAVEPGKDQDMVMAEARPEQRDGGAIHDSATRCDLRELGVAVAGGITG